MLGGEGGGRARSRTLKWRSIEMRIDAGEKDTCVKRLGSEKAFGSGEPNRLQNRAQEEDAAVCGQLEYPILGEKSDTERTGGHGISI
ncbi:hypothetical protein F2Q70_00027807 [Brassica cretica]|uniref:Uncharacterized protein n=1 Tax=Brassica cretica TaxID=69181 RepID=A0A8S9L799_BRACR|nr:hypothetical protein F2Q68_00027386 [Brassica cretica]KAF2602072.1 hypothetical protein F2Q70_00027807 [Brassica cretica]